MAKEQVKFYVTVDEKKRLETLAKLRFMSVPTYAKVTALGVKVQQVKEVYVEQYSVKDEQFFDGAETVLSDEDKQVLEEVLQRSTKKGFIQYGAHFNERLQEMAERLVGK